MIRTKLANLHISPSWLHSVSSVRIPSSVNNYRIMLPNIRLSIIMNYTKPFNAFKSAECILMFLSAMTRGVSVAHI